jgi:hypothetical protein
MSSSRFPALLYDDRLDLPRPIRAAVERCRRAIQDLDFEDQRVAVAVLVCDFRLAEKARSAEGAAERLH